MNDEQMRREFIPTRVMSLQIPECIDFGFCCIQKNIVRQFKLFNYKNTPLEFEFSETFFHINPSRGTVLPNHQEIVSFSCTFNEAQVVVAKTVLSVTGEEPQVIRISAIGKYPFLRLSTKLINFNEVSIGGVLQQEFEIINPSEVDVNFSIA